MFGAQQEEQQQQNFQVAWLKLIAGEAEDARSLVLEVASQRYWERFLIKYQRWLDNGMPIATLQYITGFDNEQSEQIYTWLRTRSAWNPREEEQPEIEPEVEPSSTPATAPTAPASAKAQPGQPLAVNPNGMDSALYMSGNALLTAMTDSRLSILVCGTPGVGKTTTAKAWLLNTLKNKPNALIRVVGLKNYDWYGLATLPHFAVALDQNGDRSTNFQPLVSVLEWADSILRQRRMSEEGTDFSRAPVWVMLNDYTPIANELLKLQPELAKKIFTLIYRLITVGREYNMGVFVDLHSLNLDILGFAGSYERGGMLLVGIGFEWREVNETRGNYYALHAMLKNDWISAYGSRFRAELPKATAHAEQAGFPLFWTSSSGEKLGIMPDLSRIKAFPSLPEAFLQQYGDRLNAAIISTEQAAEEVVAEKVTDWTQTVELAPAAISWSLTEWAINTESALARAVKLLVEAKGKKFVKEQVLACRGTDYTAIGEPWLQLLLSKGE